MNANRSSPRRATARCTNGANDQDKHGTDIHRCPPSEYPMKTRICVRILSYLRHDASNATPASLAKIGRGGPDGTAFPRYRRTLSIGAAAQSKEAAQTGQAQPGGNGQRASFLIVRIDVTACHAQDLRRTKLGQYRNGHRNGPMTSGSSRFQRQGCELHHQISGAGTNPLSRHDIGHRSDPS